MAQGSSDRSSRRHVRIPLSAEVRFGLREYAYAAPPDLFEGQIVNISVSGVAFKTRHNVSEGMHIEMVALQSNPVRCVEVTGKVLRCETLLEINTSEPDKSPSRCFLVAVEFSRMLRVEELALMRGHDPLEATVADRRAATPASDDETTAVKNTIITRFLDQNLEQDVPPAHGSAPIGRP